MDKSLDTIKSIDKPIDELGELDDQFEDLLNAAAHASAQTQRFVLAIDATSSMGTWWAMSKSALKDAVDYLQSNTNVPVSIKILAYRDHEYDRDIVEQSEWSDDGWYLKNYIGKMTCKGGGDAPESIGHGLSAILADQLTPAQVVLIGDARGKNDSTGYPEATRMGQMNCPIYALYTHDDPKVISAFKKLASLSGGKAMLFTREMNLTDIFKVIFTSNKKLAITYQATSIEGRRLAEEINK